MPPSLRLRYVKTDPEEVLKVVEKLRLYNADANRAFLLMDVQRIADNHGISERVAEIRRGWSASNVKKFRNNPKYIPKKIPLVLAGHFFNQHGFDVTHDKLISAFKSLDFEIQLTIDAVPSNTEPGEAAQYSIENLDFEIHEAKGIAEVDGREVRVRVGFEQTRVTLRSEEVRNIGNTVAGESPIDAESAEADPDYVFRSGIFSMRLVDRDPLSWVFDDKAEDGKPMDGRGVAKKLAKVAAKHGTALFAELTAKEEALTVRCVGRVAENAPNSIVEENRERMVAALTRRSIANKVDEFLLLEVPLYSFSDEVAG